jgi:hypothetical protein
MNPMSEIEMMSLRRSQNLFQYVKFILGTAGLFGILILIGEINGFLQR